RDRGDHAERQPPSAIGCSGQSGVCSRQGLRVRRSCGAASRQDTIVARETARTRSGDDSKLTAYHLSTVPALRELSEDDRPPLAAIPRPSSSIFDIAIDLAQPSELLRTISGWASEWRTRRVMYVNAHVVNQSRATPGLGGALRRADLVYCDGYGV